MNEYITTLQTKIDEVKQSLVNNSEYATLSGLNMLPRNWIVDPYVYSAQTGISPKINEDNNVTSFVVEYDIKVKKHYIDEKPCYSECNNTIKSKIMIPSGDWKPLADYSQEEKNLLAEQAKIDAKVEEMAIKQAEHDFLNGTLRYILRED